MKTNIFYFIICILLKYKLKMKTYYISIICYLSIDNKYQNILIDIHTINKDLYYKLKELNYIIDIYKNDKDKYYIKLNHSFYKIHNYLNYYELLKYITYKKISSNLLNEITFYYS